MLEILFRGARCKDNAWVQGLLWHNTDKSAVIYSDDLDRPCWVKPETVGRFTGLTDKNGKKIFEGDIIKLDDEKIRVIRYDDQCAGFYFVGDSCGLCVSLKKERMVIGNVHDTPELLEGGY